MGPWPFCYCKPYQKENNIEFNEKMDTDCDDCKMVMMSDNNFDLRALGKQHVSKHKRGIDFWKKDCKNCRAMHKKGAYGPDKGRKIVEWHHNGHRGPPPFAGGTEVKIYT